MSDTLQSMFENQPIEVPISEKRVGFGKRLGATLLDGLILLIISVVLYFVIGDSISGIAERAMSAQMLEAGADVEAMPAGMSGFVSVIAVGSVVMIIASILIALMELFMGQSPAKMMLGITIAHADGRKGNFSVWAVRWLLKQVANIFKLIAFFLAIPILDTISGLIGLVFFIGCFFALSDKKQALHDIIAKTAIYNTEDVR